MNRGKYRWKGKRMIKRVLKITTTMALILPLCGVVFAGVDRTAGVAVNSVVQEPITPGPVLDDFNDGGKLNNWGYNTGSFDFQGGSCIDSRVTTSPQEGPYCLKLDYDVSSKDSYSGYWTLLGGENLSAYTSISFWVKGTAGRELFKVELKNNSSSAAVYITDYLDGGVTTIWQEVTIPFHNFVNINNWSGMTELVFTFENSQSGTNGSPVQGTIYIDRISFGSSPVNEVRIDYFGDKIGTCALGGNIGDMQPSPTPPAPQYYTHSFTTDEYISSPGALASSYNATSDPWGGQFIIFGGGADGWTEIPHNFSDYNYLSLYVKAKSEAENPKKVKIEIIDNSATRSVTLTNITTSWKDYTIQLTSFSGLDKTTIRKMTIVYEQGVIDTAGGSRQGVLYIDNLQFEK
jgi:hypothetical protein